MMFQLSNKPDRREPRIELMPFTEVTGLDDDDHSLAADRWRDCQIMEKPDARSESFSCSSAHTLPVTSSTRIA
ncbi:MAG: hypothetical protein H7Y09_12735 [Chitinophagaceae bacterium]|nr:hypothetical protein [Anaerolineae bacterium]